MKTGTAIYKPGQPMDDLRLSAHRIRTIRDSEGMLLGFGVTAPGSKVIVKRFPDMGMALHALGQTCDYIYGPMREKVA